MKRSHNRGMDPRILLPESQLAANCRRWRIRELSAFGSALRDDFGPESDIDFLVTFESGAAWNLLDRVRMQMELSELLGRPVDLVSRRAVEWSPNPIRRAAILRTARTVYAA